MPSPFITEHQSRSISPLLTMYSSNKHQSRAADISRILDPSYCSPSTSKAYVSPEAYVDPYGDLHDPDYRHFPTSFPSSSSSSSTKRHNSPRPHWELSLDNENAVDDESDELDEEDSFFLSTCTAAHPQNHSRYSAARRSSHNSIRRPRESSFSTYATNYSSNYYSPTTTTSTLPTSYESDKTILSELDEKDGKKTKKRRRLSKGDKEKEKEREGSAVVSAAETYYRGSLDRSRDLPPTEEEEPEDDEYARFGSPATTPKGALIRSTLGKDIEFVPSCTQSFRRQWAALSLRFRFSVFRAQRKVMRRVQSLLWTAPHPLLAPTRLEIINKKTRTSDWTATSSHLSITISSSMHTSCIIIIVICKLSAHKSMYIMSYLLSLSYPISLVLAIPPILIRSVSATHCHTPINQQESILQHITLSIHPSIGRFRFSYTRNGFSSHKFITYHHRHWDFSFVYQYLILPHEHFLYLVLYFLSFELDARWHSSPDPFLYPHLYLYTHKYEKWTGFFFFATLFLIWWALWLGCITISFVLCLPNSNEIQIL